jgi:hypothetical protein
MVVSTDFCTTVLNYINQHCLGKINAKTAKQIAFYLGASERKIRLAISILRRQEEPIVSNTTDGFFIPLTEEEAQEIYHIRNRAYEIFETYRGLEKGIQKRFPVVVRQMKLDLDLKEIA